MSAIEKITSKTKEIHIATSDSDAPADVIEVPVWNSTVANLTLMALGESPTTLQSSVQCSTHSNAHWRTGPFNMIYVSDSLTKQRPCLAQGNFKRKEKGSYIW